MFDCIFKLKIFLNQYDIYLYNEAKNVTIDLIIIYRFIFI